MSATAQAELIFPMSAAFPLGQRFGDSQPTQAEDGRGPFGTRLAVQPKPVPVDLQHVGYDSVRQVGMVDDGGVLVPLARHSTGTTSTNTSREDMRPPDSDSDATED